jgi:hypothetical protein
LWRVPLVPNLATPERVSDTRTRGLAWSESGLFTIGHEPTDGYSVAVSHDDGRSFEPFFRLCEASVSVGCPADSSVARQCSAALDTAPWQPLGDVCAPKEVAPPPGPALDGPARHSDAVSGSCAVRSRNRRDRGSNVLTWAVLAGILIQRRRTRRAGPEEPCREPCPR